MNMARHNSKGDADFHCYDTINTNDYWDFTQ